MADSATAWAKASPAEEETSAARGRSAVAKAGEAPSTRSLTTKSRSEGPKRSPARGRAQEQPCNQTGLLSRRILVASFADRHLLLVERLIVRRRGERLFVEIG